MAVCEVCGNEYDKTIEITAEAETTLTVESGTPGGLPGLVNPPTPGPPPAPGGPDVPDPRPPGPATPDPSPPSPTPDPTPLPPEPNPRPI